MGFFLIIPVRILFHPSLFLCNADARNYRHSRAWMLHSTYARWGSHILGWPLWMFSLTAAFPLLHHISKFCSDVRCTCGCFLPIQIRPFPHNRNDSTAPLSKAGFLFPENVRKVSCRRSPSGISRSQLWIISEGLTQNSVHGLLPHIQTDGP